MAQRAGPVATLPRRTAWQISRASRPRASPRGSIGCKPGHVARGSPPLPHTAGLSPAVCGGTTERGGEGQLTTGAWRNRTSSVLAAQRRLATHVRPLGGLNPRPEISRTSVPLTIKPLQPRIFKRETLPYIPPGLQSRLFYCRKIIYLGEIMRELISYL